MTASFAWDSPELIGVDRDAISDLIAELLVKRKMFLAEARMVVDRMLEAADWGFFEHGPARAASILSAIELGDIDARAQLILLQEGSALAVLDGGKGVGEVAGTRAVDRAVQMAGESGCATVIVRNSQAWGSTVAHAARLADAGFVGICATSAGRAAVRTSPDGEPTLGSSETVWALPAGGDQPILVSLSPSRYSPALADRLELFGLSGADFPNESFPLLWGQSIVSTALTGLLAGGKLSAEKRANPALDGAEHFIYAIDASQCCDLDSFRSRVSDWARSAAAGDTSAVGLPTHRIQQQLQLHAGELSPLLDQALRFKIVTSLAPSSPD